MALKLKNGNRAWMAKLASETVRILDAKEYSGPDGSKVELGEQLDACLAATRLYTPTDLANLVPQVKADLVGAETFETVIEVTPETTLAATKRLSDSLSPAKIAALNFASAKNPGGGFRGGSQAQEESLARASGLFATLTSPQAEPYYQTNRPTRDCIYTDHLIWSPQVPVFRAEGPEFGLLAEPWPASFITSPATNAGEAKKRYRPAEEWPAANAEIMSRRIEQVLAVAKEQGMEGLVLGAWGCGAFGNAEADIAALFRRHLIEGAFKGAFKRIVFAVYVRRPDDEGNLRAFKEALKMD